MGRTRKSIDSKRHRLGISDCINSTDNIVAKQIGKLVGQHEKSIYNRWKKNGLPLKPFGTRYYVINEKELVKFMQEHHELWRASQCDYYFFCKYDWFLERLKKERDGTDTINYCRNRRPWTTYELSRAKMLWKKGLHYTEIAIKLGRTDMAAYHVVRKFRSEE